MNRGPSVSISCQRSYQSRSPGNTQFLLYETSGPKWVKNQGETAVHVREGLDHVDRDALTSDICLSVQSIEIRLTALLNSDELTWLGSFVSPIAISSRPVE
jgi:hypothetical protein